MEGALNDVNDCLKFFSDFSVQDQVIRERQHGFRKSPEDLRGRCQSGPGRKNPADKLGPLLSEIRLRFQEHTCLTSYETAPYFKLDVNFTLYFVTCGNRIHLKYVSLSVSNTFLELETLFQNFIWKKIITRIQIVLKEHQQLQITWRRFNTFQIEAYTNSWGVKKIR